MSKIQSYDKNIYPCIRDAVYEIMDRHLLVAGDVSIYDAAALNDVLFFLCENGIKHEYITMPAPSRAECDEVISLVWMEDKDYGNEVWYSRGETDAKKTSESVWLYPQRMNVKSKIGSQTSAKLKLWIGV